MENNGIRAVILRAFADCLKAQVRAVNRLRGAGAEKPTHPKERMSHTSMAYNILFKAGQPLHITQIIEEIEKQHGLKVDRESIVSALSKRIARGDRFVRTAKNTFGVREGNP